MASPIIKIKRSSVQGKSPGVADLPLGELAINTYDGSLFLSKSTDSGVSTSIVNVSGVQIQDEGSLVGYANTINFVGSAVTVLSISNGVGIVSFSGGEVTLSPGKTSTSFTATEGQTSFSVSYEVGYVEVYLNGVRLSSTEYTATDGSTIVLSEGASADDILDVVEFIVGIGVTGPTGATGASGALSGVTATTSSSTHYPLIVTGVGSTTPFITTTSNYFEFNPSSGTLKTNQLDVNGSVSANTFTSTSDINLKDNIETFENSLDTILSIRGVRFNWKKDNKSDVGVVAQEIEKVLPELVSNTDIKSVNYNGLIGLLIEGIKEQQQQINILKQEIENLKK